MQEMAIRTVALTLLHFLWQGALIGALAAAALRGHIARTAKRRYVICLAALLACAVAPMITAMLIFERSSGQAARPGGPPTGGASLHLFQLTFPDLHGHAMFHSVNVPAVDLMSVGVLLWLIGALSMAVYYVMQWFGVEAIRRSAFPLRSPEHFGSCAAQLLRQWKSTVRVSVMLSHAIATPVVIGLWRPLIVFPAATIARMSMRDFELILLHEIAHIVRRDTLANALQVVLEILLFYHPVVHWLSRRTRAERECACDEFVVTATGSAYRYAQALTGLALTSARGAPLQLGAASGELLLRLRNLAGDQPEGPAFPRGKVQLLMLALLLIFLLWAYAPDTWRGFTHSTGTSIRKQPSVVPLEPLVKPNTAARSNESPEVVPVRNIDSLSSVANSARLRRTRVTPRTRTTVPAADTLPDEIKSTRSSQQPSEAETPVVPTVEQQTSPGVTPIDPPERVIDDEASSKGGAGPTPIYQPMPEYPVRARLEGIQGSVVATLRVGADGRTTGLRVEEATPVGVFEGAVRRSLMRWRYDFTGSSAPAPETVVSYRLNFSLDGVSSATTSVCATATASRTCEPQ